MDFATRRVSRRSTRIKRIILFFFFLGRQIVVGLMMHVHVFEVESSVSASIFRYVSMVHTRVILQVRGCVAEIIGQACAYRDSIDRLDRALERKTAYL